MFGISQQLTCEDPHPAIVCMKHIAKEQCEAVFMNILRRALMSLFCSVFQPNSSPEFIKLNGEKKHELNKYSIAN